MIYSTCCRALPALFVPLAVLAVLALLIRLAVLGWLAFCALACSLACLTVGLFVTPGTENAIATYRER